MAAGSRALQAGDLPRAAAAFRAATVASPGSAEAFFGLGLVALRQGQPEAAAAALTKATRLDERLQGAHLFLGIADYQLGQVEPAVASLRAELAVAPDSMEALTWLTIVLLGADRAGEAVPVIDHAVSLRPDDAQLLYFQAKAHGAVVKAALGRLYALDPESALVHRATAESLDGSGDVTKAVLEYQAALKKDPGNPDLMEALGQEQLKAGQVEAAAATFQEELGRNPNSSTALYNLGRLDVEKGKPADGVALLRRALAEHAPGSPTSFYLGLGLAELNQNEEAERSLKASLTADAPAFVRQGAWYQLARVYAKLGRKAEQGNALAQLKKVLDEQNREKEATAKAARAQSPGLQPAGQP